MENSMEMPQKIKNTTNYFVQIQKIKNYPLLGVYPKSTKTLI